MVSYVAIQGAEAQISSEQARRLGATGTSGKITAVRGGNLVVQIGAREYSLASSDVSVSGSSKAISDIKSGLSLVQRQPASDRITIEQRQSIVGGGRIGVDRATGQEFIVAPIC